MSGDVFNKSLLFLNTLIVSQDEEIQNTRRVVGARE